METKQNHNSGSFEQYIDFGSMKRFSYNSVKLNLSGSFPFSQKFKNLETGAQMVWIFPVKLSKFRNASNAVDQIFRKFPVRNCKTGVHLARLSSFPLIRSRKCYSIRHKKFRKFKPEIFHRIGTPVIPAIPVTLEISGKLDSWRPGGLGALDSGLSGPG